MRVAELREQIDSRLQILEIGFAPHDYSDPWGSLAIASGGRSLRFWVWSHCAGTGHWPAIGVARNKEYLEAQLKSDVEKTDRARWKPPGPCRARAPRVGLEPTTTRLTVERSTN